MHIHILGICGTFMGGIALLARQAGHEVSGSDQNVYPPMSTQLEEQGISLMEGYDPAHLDNRPDMVVIGNVMSRGNPVIELILNRGIPCTSGPQWLYEYVLKDRWVLAVAGTHGKTTTSSMLAWILEYAGMNPGYLIGGVPDNFGISARFGDEPFFVIEADEYDTAFFDKRSKFIHYHPRTLVANNLEFDHADIFTDLADIQRQFHYLVRTIPGEGLIICNRDSPALDTVLEQGCWTPVEKFSCAADSAEGWNARNMRADGSSFDLYLDNYQQGRLEWAQLGQHNISNAMAAIAAARHAGVPTRVSLEALSGFKGVKRRLELRADIKGIRLYDDFAHHPTAIETTLAGLRGHVGDKRICVLLEPRSNTMRMGIHENTLANSLREADTVSLYQPGEMAWNLSSVTNELGDKAKLFASVDDMVDDLKKQTRQGDSIVVMSNGGFGGIHGKLEKMLQLL
ncbi:MAG TPA: UDP-N-acetylmuramate:L-alanyl-gamma-D-glutamyl-meso-diaminopimelate ligase [Gammaproteobacteria bacterium]|nr:UDP-N-acetylmuramate:L-alanyl-gamma-D-glutamyl-meso-diaminopimelate ligase [Gammaproteobacteria bacterium]